MTDTERCKHDMIKAYCTFCRTPDRGTGTYFDPGAPRRTERRHRFLRASLTGKWRMAGFLAVRATVSMTARDEDKAGDCADEYRSVTGDEHIVPINPTKWGHSIEFDFLALDSEVLQAGIGFEEMSAVSRDRHDRVVSNVALGWALFDLGFKLGRGQDTELIRENVPEGQREAFDLGVAIGRKS
ncbi:hypothetical protein LCGC14_1753950 [marine sediment metagenome]|uniref:Uncharacterized protein n=1 Tax=marine sediment metagenome TaxID=412755 RepID=A0A0F9H325_9ZZZZ